jgi:hypothetical protein
MFARSVSAVLAPALCVWAMLCPGDAAAQLRIPQVPVLGGGLQAYFSGVGESINVNTEQLELQWLSAPVGFNSSYTLMIEFSVKSANVSLGIYDAAAAAPTLIPVFPAEAGAGWFAVLSYRTAPVRVIVNLFDDSATLRATTTHPGGNRNAIGWYLEAPGALFFSQDGKNPSSDPQFLWFAGTGWNRCIWWAAAEATSLSGGSDSDFDDVVLLVEDLARCPDDVQRSTWGAIKSRFR